MMAALGCGCLPCRSRSAWCKVRTRSAQVPLRRERAIRDRKPFATAESWLVSSARDILCVGRRRPRRRWLATGELAACHVWTRQGDSVGDTPIPHQKDYWDNLYLSFQSITEPPLRPFQNTVSERQGKRGNHSRADDGGAIVQRSSLVREKGLSPQEILTPHLCLLTHDSSTNVWIINDVMGLFM